MPPLKKARQVSRRGREVEEVGDMSQCGRSGSILEAERNSAEIRSQVSSLEATRRDSSGSTMVRSDAGSAQLQQTPSTLSLPRRSSYTPVVPSPLNPSSSQSSVGTEEGRPESESDGLPTGSSEGATRSRSAAYSPIMAGGRRQGGDLLSPVQQLFKQKSALASGPETPKHLKDLGRDYSRYPPPTPSLERRKPGPGHSVVSSSDLASASLLRTTTTNPFSDSQANLEKWGYPDDSIGAFDPYFGGEKGFILYENEVEADDKIHSPADDDDQTYKPHWKEYCNRRSIVSGTGGIFLVLGLLCVFILFPVLTFTTRIYHGDPSGSGGGGESGIIDTGPAWAHVNNNSYPLLNNVRRGLIDPDTPDSVKTRTSKFDGSTLNLVFSDEFNQPNRTFYPGDDPFWTAPNLWYGATQDMEWYDPDAVTTGGGTLQLRMDAFPNHNLPYRSGMLNSWNQLCFKGGIFEVSVSLPGPSGIAGLWPGVWTMGNLGRPGHLATTEGVWPYTYDSCDAGITPNQSSPDGISFLPGQKLSSCTCTGEDHPTPGTGRGAPEIDILEAAADVNLQLGVITQSFQVAPFDIFYYPNAAFMQIPNSGGTTTVNAYTGGPYQQAVSATTTLNNDWYDGEAYQTYAFEYIPGPNGKIVWLVGSEETFTMDGRAIGPNGNIGARLVSEEPMSMVLNLGMSGTWGAMLLDRLKFPTVMHIDYVRIYQKPGEEMITCDPPGYETTEYIKNHPLPYNNPNITRWNQTEYSWPKNTLTGNC